MKRVNVICGQNEGYLNVKQCDASSNRSRFGIFSVTHKVHPCTGTETLITTALEGGEWSASWLGRSLPPGTTRYPLCRRLGGSQGRSGQVQKISAPPGFDPRTVQPRSQSLYSVTDALYQYDIERSQYSPKCFIFLHLYLGLKFNFSSLTTMCVCSIFWCDEYLAVLMLGAYGFFLLCLNSGKKLANHTGK